MLNLPRARSKSVKRSSGQFKFGGIKHSEGARDGAIYDMENMSLDSYPAMTVRKGRRKAYYDITGKVYGIGGTDVPFWCSGASGNEAAAEQSFASGENANSILASETGDQSANGALEGANEEGDSSATPQNDLERGSYQTGARAAGVEDNGEAWFFYNGTPKFTLSASEKTFSIVNKYICIFPDKMYYSLWDAEKKGTYESLDALKEAFKTVEVKNNGDVYAVGTKEPYSYYQYLAGSGWTYLMDSWGKLDGMASYTQNSDGYSFFSKYYDTENSLRPVIAIRKSSYAADPLDWIRIGDMVKITTITKSGTVSIKYTKIVEETKLVEDYANGQDFYLLFTDSLISISKTSTSTRTETLIFERVIPDLEFSFCHDNRLWGVEGDKIYASKLGDPFNFIDYSTLADASWTVAVASNEPFTGGIAYNGYPTFFKEDRIIRVSGNYPAQYSTYETADVPGVLEGSSKSLSVANGYLYYLSPEGVCAYSGSYPYVIGEDIGEVLSEGVGGAGADKYFLEASYTSSTASGPPSPQGEGLKAVYVYDTRYGSWTKESAINAVGFTDIGRELYALSEDGIFVLDSDKDMGEAEEDFGSFAEFAPIYDGHLAKKGISRLHVSLKAEDGAKVSFYISCDDGEWIKLKEVSGTKRKTFNIPLTIKRCGFYRLKIEGKGAYTVYGIGKVRYFGSDM